jgi:hypothetical protein
MILSAVLATVGGAMALSASAGPITGSARDSVATQSVVEPVQDSRYCRRLRRACEFKEERGEAGEGNCRRYRRECGRY